MKISRKKEWKSRKVYKVQTGAHILACIKKLYLTVIEIISSWKSTAYFDIFELMIILKTDIS